MKHELIAFIALSTVVHALIFVDFTVWSFNINEHQKQGRSSLDVELIQKQQVKKVTPLIQNKKNPPPAPSKPHLIKKPNKNPESIITVQRQAPAIIQAQIKKEPVSAIEPQDKRQHSVSTLSQIAADKKEKNHAESDRKTQENISTRLKSAFSKYFYYPKAAIRKNWQGQLMLGFTIHKDGHINNIHIEKSSGYKILDNAALTSFNKIDLKNTLKGLTLHHSINQRLPISYHLNQL